MTSSDRSADLRNREETRAGGTETVGQNHEDIQKTNKTNVLKDVLQHSEWTGAVGNKVDSINLSKSK